MAVAAGLERSLTFKEVIRLGLVWQAHRSGGCLYHYNLFSHKRRILLLHWVMMVIAMVQVYIELTELQKTSSQRRRRTMRDAVHINNG